MGGSGGGGSSGAVDWPDYLENTQNDWLSSDEADSINTNMTEAINAAHTNNPYTSYQVYGAEHEQSLIDRTIIEFSDLVDQIVLDWNTLFGNSMGLFDQAIASYLVFLELDPKAIQGIKTDWELPYLPAYETVRDNWELPVLPAYDTIKDDWNHPEPSSATDIDESWKVLPDWEDPSPDGPEDIKNNWLDASEWEDPSPGAQDTIDAVWKTLPDWEDPEPDAAEDIIDNLANEAYVAASTNAFGNVLDDQITSEVLPRFQAGMSDINAVMSTAFVIGQSVIEGMRDRDVAKFQADLRYKAFLQRDNLLGQSYMQDDQILAQSLLEENKAGFANTVEESKTISQGVLQDDQ